MAAILTTFWNGFLLNESVWIPIEISLKFVSKRPNQKYSIIGSDYGLVPARWQAIVWTNDG